jgi:hypothetical protein
LLAVYSVVAVVAAGADWAKTLYVGIRLDLRSE